jgi:cytochrome c551/c552
MIGFRHTAVAFGIGIIAATAAPALAQLPPGAPAPTTTTAPTAADTAAMNQAIDQRVAALQAKLGVTPAQSADWTNFAQAMRDNASSTNQLFQQRAQNAATMTAVDNIKSYADIARAYADSTERLSTAFAAFYAKLSPDQQKTADALFRQPPPPAAKHK